MMETHLRERLKRVIARRQWYLASWWVAGIWGAVAVLGCGFHLIARQSAWSSSLILPLLACTGLITSVVALYRTLEGKPDYREIARHIERRHPDLRGLLLTAVQQEFPAGARPNYLQYRVLQEALERSNTSDWREVVPRSRFRLAQGVNLVAFAVAMLVLPKLYVGPSTVQGPVAAPLWGVAVDPGDVALEKGENLVVLARFGGELPTGVDLVIRTSGQPQRQFPLVKNLSDPVFSGSVPEVAQDLTYHLEYAGRSTRDYKVTVYEHPRMERADITLTFPAYTGLDPKRIENTRRVSAVEGTVLDIALQLNKPVRSAQLVSRDEAGTVIPLEVRAGQASARLAKLVLKESVSYDLQLLDAEGRTGKPAAPLVFEALPNRPPELKLATPRGDQKPSAVEEVNFAGTVLDDFGVSAYGLGYSVGDGEPTWIELGRGTTAKEKRPFNHVLELEQLGIKPRQLVATFLWADDIGPDGQVRRTTSDILFLEVRPFELVFRQGQGGGGGSGPPPQPTLLEIQKRIMTATWNLRRAATAQK